MTAPMTLSAAISLVRGHIDDTIVNAAGNGRRWTKANVIGALGRAVSTCLEEYAKSGGDRFYKEVEVTATAGRADLLVHDPIHLGAVLVLAGSSFTEPVGKADPQLRGTPDTQTRTLLLRLVSRPRMPTADDDFLVGVEGGEARPWGALEAWICMVAAQELGIKDDKARRTLEIAEAKQRDKVITKTRYLPGGKPYPRRRRGGALLRLRYVWLPQTATLVLYNDTTGRW